MSALPHVIDVTLENFPSEVVEKSKQTPVLLEFYADDAEPSRVLAPVLMRLAEQYQGKFILGRVNIADNPPLVQQLGVRTLPTLKLIVNGQVAQNLEGPQDEAKLRSLLDQVTISPIEKVREQINMLLEDGNRQAAIKMLQEVIANEPTNYRMHAELCDLLIMEGRADEAKQILDALPEDTDGIDKPRSRLEFIALVGELPSLEEMLNSIEKNPDDLQLRFNIAIAQVVNDEIELALENLLMLMQKDLSFEDEISRKTMIKIFSLLGKGNELATRYRRQMFSLLH